MKTFDADLKLAILSEVAPKALAPQIAMNSASLSTYKTLREFIVQYLKSKNLWRRSAGTTFGSASASSAPYSGRAPMEIGAVDVADAKPHKGKETKGGKGGKKGNPDKGSRGSPAKGDGKSKDNRKGDPSGKSGKGVLCAICSPDKGKNHTTDACFFNARANPKGDGKTNKRAPDKNLSATISTLQTQLDALRSSANPSMPSGHSEGRKGQGAIQEMLFVISDTPAQAVEVTEQVAATSSTKYVLLDSGATTSCASDQCFPGATVDATRQKELWAPPFDTRVN